MSLKPTYEELEKRINELSNAECELKLSIKRFNQSEERFRNIIEGSIQGVLIHREHKPLFVNKKWANIHGYSPEEILVMNTVVQLICPKDQSRMIKFKEVRLQGNGAPVDYEYQGVHKDGSLIWLENRVSVVQWYNQAAIQTTIFDITSRKKAEVERERLIGELNNALLEVKSLSGIIPICMHCKQIRDDKGYWNQLEEFISKHSGAQFSHGLCDACLKKYYPEED